MKSPCPYHVVWILIIFFSHSQILAQDSTRLLKKVTVRGIMQINRFTNLIPSQSLNKETMQQINAPSVGDAARFFSGVQVKDYGGAGGLKTISIRSLGAAQTGIMYDGITVSDAQSGQVDLSLYSSTFIRSIDLFQANSPGILLPARAFSSASILSINTQFNSSERTGSWAAGIRSGSFAYLNALIGANFVLSPGFVISGNIEAVSSKGNYPFTVDNGNIREKAKRNNAALKSLQGELNVSGIFKDSSTLQIKGWAYDSKRGLPGTIIFFNNRSVQELFNQNYFLQGRYKKTFGSRTSLQLLGKFNHTYTRYVDPDFLNNMGGLDDQYRQSEGYISAAVSQKLGRFISMDLASDIAYAALKANKTRFSIPTRISNWNNLLLNYADSMWQWNASLLWNRFSDQTRSGPQAEVRNKFTPTIAVSRKFSAGSPFLFRTFYKQLFRMPTFNDLYYNFIGNTKLKPEYARQYNGGITYSKSYKGKLRQLNMSADAYYNTIKDKIIALPAQNLFSWTMLNLGRVEVRGIDITTEAAGVMLSQVNWFLRLAYTFQKARDMTDPSASTYKDRIPYSPDHSGSGIFSAQYKYWTAGYSFSISGTRYTIGENNPYNLLDGWGVQDLFVSRNIPLQSFKIKLKGEINNIGNDHYDVIRYYPMPGRSYKISILFGKL